MGKTASEVYPLIRSKTVGSRLGSLAAALWFPEPPMNPMIATTQSHPLAPLSVLIRCSDRTGWRLVLSSWR
jgi:hypothetical protein